MLSSNAILLLWREVNAEVLLEHIYLFPCNGEPDLCNALPYGISTPAGLMDLTVEWLPKVSSGCRSSIMGAVEEASDAVVQASGATSLSRTSVVNIRELRS